MARAPAKSKKRHLSEAQVQAMYRQTLLEQSSANAVNPLDLLNACPLPAVDYHSAFRRRSREDIRPGNAYLMLPSQVIGAFDPVRILGVLSDGSLRLDALPARCQKPSPIGTISPYDATTLRCRPHKTRLLLFEAVDGQELAQQYDEIAAQRRLAPLEEATLRELGFEADTLLALDQDATRQGADWQIARTARVDDLLQEIEGMCENEPWKTALRDWTFLEDSSLDLQGKGVPTLCAIPGEPRANRTLLAYPADWTQPSRAIASWLVRRAYLQTRLEPGGDIALQCEALTPALLTIFDRQGVDHLFAEAALDLIRKDWTMSSQLYSKSALSQLPGTLPDVVLTREPSGQITLRTEMTRFAIRFNAQGELPDVFDTPDSAAEARRMSQMAWVYRENEAHQKLLFMAANIALSQGLRLRIHGHSAQEFARGQDHFTVDFIDPDQADFPLSTLQVEAPSSRVFLPGERRMIRFAGAQRLEVLNAVLQDLHNAQNSSDQDPAMPEPRTSPVTDLQKS